MKSSLRNLRVGNGFDVHQFEEGKPLKLGGVVIPHVAGLRGHSDGDALLHAIIDALLGATSSADIGFHFPDTDLAWKDADSASLLQQVWQKLGLAGWTVVNIDTTIVTELPKLAPYRERISESIASVLGVSPSQIGVKATTCEQLGFLGRGEGLLALATVLLLREDKEKSAVDADRDS